MHAARAIHKQREKREEKQRLDVRRASAVSQSSRRVSRSPAVSVDTSARKSHSHNDESDNLNVSYIGFIIAVFGAVPLIVGTFVEVPALWEIGLGVTLLGLFIGVVFWCTELCAEAKRFSQKKNQLSTRGKIEDSNLLHVPDRKFGNGLDSRRSSFQSDSVSLISPAVQHYTPKHHPDLPQLAHNLGSRQSISQHSSEFSTSSGRANGHLIPPALILRGNGRKDDGRVVSLVQPDPGLDDDSDSDAETVIEAPTAQHSNTKVIQVQSCQERQHPQQLLQKAPFDTSFNIVNEKISPLSQQHRIIRMPVMPQEVDKLQRCECGRYLLTERDKLVGIRLPGIGGSSSESTTTSNSPTPMISMNVNALGPGNNIASRNKTFSENLETEESNNDTHISGGSDVTTPLADQPPPPPPNKIISVSPSVKITPTIPPTPKNASGERNAHETNEDTTVQINPTPGSSTSRDFLGVSSARSKTENLDDDFDDDDDIDEGDVTPGNEASRTFQTPVVVDEDEDEEKLLTELLELTDVNDDEIGRKETESADQNALEQESSNDKVNARETEKSHVPVDIPQQNLQLSREGSRRRLEFQSQVTSINRPTSLPLPKSVSLDEENSSVNNLNSAAECCKSRVNTDIQPSTQTDDNQNQGQSRIHSDKIEKNKNNEDLGDDISLDELLDSIEKNQDGEVLAVVVQ